MNSDKNNDEVSIKDLIVGAKKWFDYLLSHYKTIVLCVILGAILGIGFSFLQKPVYTAALTFALEDEKSGGGLTSTLAGQLGLDLGGNGGGMFEGGNLMELFKSRKMVEKTLLTTTKKNITLAQEYIYNSKINKSWKNNLKLKKLKFTENPNRIGLSREHDSILGVISGNIIKTDLLVVQKEKKVSIITIELKSNNEQFAKKFTEALAREVSEFYIETKSKKAKKNLEILIKQTDSVRRALNGAITGVAVATDNVFGLNPALNVKRVPSTRKSVDVQANTAILSELIKQTELAKVTVRKETPLIQIIDAPILPLPKEKFGKLKGLIIGGFLSGFVTIIFLILKRVLKSFIN